MSMIFTETDVLNMINPRKNPEWKRSITLGIVALFWDQTESEQASRKTIYTNNRGFNQVDARNGTIWAKYATHNLDPADPDTDIRNIPDEYINAAANMAERYRKQLATKLTLLDQTREAEELEREMNEKYPDEAKAHVKYNTIDDENELYFRDETDDDDLLDVTDFD